MIRSSVRYEVLPCEEQNVPAEPVAMAMVVPPPVYTENASVEGQDPSTVFMYYHIDVYTPAYVTAKLPNYLEATSLPTYEEAERSKVEGEAIAASSAGTAVFLECESGRLTRPDDLSEVAIGSDGMFICTFLVSFLFNWLGFLLSLCLSNTVAGRCGAMSGLGLSIVKWVAIVKHNKWDSLVAEADSWLWWLLAICGFLLFVRGCVQYVRVKYVWARLNGNIRNFWMF